MAEDRELKLLANSVDNPIQLNYSIHGLLGIRILDRTGTNGALFLQNKLSPFLIPEVDQQPDLIVSLENKLSPCRELGIDGSKYHVGDDHVCWKSRQKLGSWYVSVGGLSAPPVQVRFSGNRFATKYLFFHIIEPLIDYLLALKGAILLHSSGVGDGNRGCVFASRSGTGKTSLALHLLNNGLPQFLGDEFLILTEGGSVSSFPISINLFRHNVLSNPFLRALMSPVERSRIRFNWLLSRFSFGWAKPGLALPVTKLFPNVAIPPTLPIGSLAMLFPTDGEDIQVYQHESPSQLIDELLKISKIEFRFFEKALDAYKAALPKSEVCLHDDRYRRILARIIERVPCYKVFIPRRFNFENSVAHAEFSEMLTLPLVTSDSGLSE